MERSPAVTGKEGSSKLVFTAEVKSEQRGGEGVKIFAKGARKDAKLLAAEEPRSAQKRSENIPGTWGRHVQSSQKQSHHQDFAWQLSWSHSSNTTQWTKEHALPLCRPSTFTRLCSILPLAPSNSPALLHTLPCWPDTQESSGAHYWPLPEGVHKSELGCLFLLGVGTNSCLGCLLSLARTTKIQSNLTVFETSTSCQIW